MLICLRLCPHCNSIVGKYFCSSVNLVISLVSLFLISIFTFYFGFIFGVCLTSEILMSVSVCKQNMYYCWICYYAYSITKTKLCMLKSFSLYVFLISKSMISLDVLVYIWMCLVTCCCTSVCMRVASVGSGR